jgi:DNA-binding CsgD family transcriptional regulator
MLNASASDFTTRTDGARLGPAFSIAAGRLRDLTKREREILRLLADGMRNEQIGAELGISRLTARAHIRHAMEQLESDTRTQAVASALRRALIV